MPEYFVLCAFSYLPLKVCGFAFITGKKQEMCLFLTGLFGE